MEEQQTMTASQNQLAVPSAMKQLIEGLIFAADEPLTVRQIKAIYEQQVPGGEERHIEQAEVQQIIQELNAEYQKNDKAYRIIAIAGGFQFATVKEYAEWIGRLYKEQSRRKLSQSSLESLAIIAYKQPISKPEIESIRGVNCDYVLKTLLEKELVTIVGRAQTVGRPLLYGTTREFLQHFGLNDVTDLPRPREIEEILGESQFETERRMLEAQAGAEQMKKEEEDFKSRLPHIPKKKPELDDAVHILHKKRSRTINVRESAPESNEPPEQEQIAFENPTAEVDETPQEPAAGAATSIGEELPRAEVPEPPAIADSVAVEEHNDVVEKVPLMQPDITDDKTEESGESGLETTGMSSVEEAVEVPEDEFVPVEVPLANDVQSHDVEKSEIPLIPLQKPEPEMSQPRRKRWTVWKEKVQTFIKKLFG